MPKTHDNLPLTYDWAAGENVKTGMDANLRLLGAVVQLSVISRTSDEPDSPSDGDRYIHNGGTWSVGSADDVIVRIDGAWEVYTPSQGWQAYIVDESATVVFDSGWLQISGGGGGGVDAEDNGTLVVDSASAINFDDGLNASDDGDGSATVKVAGTVLRDGDLAANGGTVPETDRTNTFDALMQTFRNNDRLWLTFTNTAMPTNDSARLEMNDYSDVVKLQAVRNGSFQFDWFVLHPDGGVAIGQNVGSEGQGTINAEAVYDDGTQLSDYVFDKYLGKQTYEYTDEVRAYHDALDERWFDPASYADYWQEHHRLPGMPDLDDVIDGKVKVGHGKLIQQLMQTAELQAIHIEQLRKRVEALESEK